MPASSEPSSQTGPAARRQARNAALRGALIASLIIVATMALRRQGDAWLLLAVALSVAASALVEAIIAARQRDHTARLENTARRAGTAESLLSQIPDPVILVDGRAVVIEANAAARSLLPGLKMAQPLSFALRAPDVLGAIDTVLTSQEPMRVGYNERIPTERAFEIHVSPLGSDLELLDLRSGVVLFFRDLTSARRLEHMRVDFVANASHELRTPLASLLGFIETLQGPAKDDPRARERFLEVMRGQARRMTRLIDDLLSLSRIEMRVHLPPSTVIDLRTVVTPMIETLTPLALEKGVAIAPAFGPGPFPVLGDRDELLRVAENLIENAVKYGDTGERVDVSLQRIEPANGRGAQIALTVRDHGPGIAPEHLPRLTERFYRADAVQSREKGGTGLGLAIVKHIVNRHRGQLVIESQLGQGASFKVLLPEAPHPAG
jgi:two-component system phosphate regulon sensor histidine kinase PhoR